MRKTLKIGVVVDQILPGGVQKQGVQEVIWLNKLGHKAKLLILMRKGFEHRYSFLLKNCPHEFLSDRYPKLFQISFKFPVFSFLSILHLTSPLLAPLKVRRGEFDIIVSLGTTTSLTMWSLSRFRKIPYIAVIHDPMVYILEKVYSQTVLRFFFPILKPLASFFERHFIQAASHCFVLSSFHANLLKGAYKVKPEVLPLPVNPPASLPKKRGDAILTFGRWQKEKNLEVLLKLLLELKRAKLIIAGTWLRREDYREFKEAVAKLNLKTRVSLIPKYSESELAKICRKGRVWVHPHFEAFSLSALEAAAHGLPIIIPEKSGVTELFQNGVHGYFPSKPTSENLKKLVEPLLNNERLALRMGSKAAEVAKHYTPKEHTRKLLAIINSVLQGKQVIRITALETGHVKGSGIAGGDRLLEEMVKRIKQKVDLTVIVPQIGFEHWKESFPANLVVLPKNPFDQYTSPLGVFLNYLVRIWQATFILFKSDHAALLYSSTGLFPDVIPPFLVKNLWVQQPWIARIHHLSPPPGRRPGRWWVNLGAYTLQTIALFAIKFKADLILVLNSNLKRKLVRLGFPERNLEILGGGVDFTNISNFKPQRSASLDGVFLGRLHPAKGIFDLVPIWKEVIKVLPESCLAIVGFGQDEIIQELKTQISEAELSRNIIITGFLPQKRVWSILKSGKVFLFTDHEAGFGLAAAEAMAAGLPVVGYDIGVLGSVFKSGYISVPLNNFSLFATKVIKILEDEKLRQELSYQAISEASKLDWTKTSQKFSLILEKISSDPVFF